jgi:hypothetical protein
VISYNVLGFLTQWKRLLKPKESLEMEDRIKKLQDGLKIWYFLKEDLSKVGTTCGRNS